MSKRKRKTHARRSSRQKPTFFLEYYRQPFLLFEDELRKTGYDPESPHPTRGHFWNLIIPGEYSQLQARALLKLYLTSLERKMASIISKHCLAYWLHLYRRIFPGPIGEDRQLATIALVRSTLEAAIQKYALLQPCGGIAFSNTVPIEKVFRGLLLSPEFEHIRLVLEKGPPQLLLTDFGAPDLIEFYDLEKLAYEIWRSTAQLRITGKGASLLVVGPPDYVHDNRGQDLARLVESYDSRAGHYCEYEATARGIVYEMDSEGPGLVFMPLYNIGKVPGAFFSEVTERLFNLKVEWSGPTNFIWLPFNLRSFYRAHLPLEGAFRAKNRVPLKDVLLVIGSLCCRAFSMWGEDQGRHLIHSWQRAYFGPSARDVLSYDIKGFAKSAAEIMDLGPSDVDSCDFEAATSFLSLDETKRKDMDLAYPGPHSVFLPISKDFLFADFAYIRSRLYDLFFDVSIPDENFKGEALEAAVRGSSSLLPKGSCLAKDGTRRQIDAAFTLGDRLVIVECRATAKSIGFHRGDPPSIQFRTERVDRMLKDVDEKAKWLTTHAVGANFDISRYRTILPIAVTPFVEFIPSLMPYYWLTESLPRVITPDELKKVLKDRTLANIEENVLVITTSE